MHDEDDIVIESASSEEATGNTEVLAKEKIGKLKEELTAAKKERQEYMDGWQRAKADYVNALRRFEEEKKEAKDAGIERAVAEFLPAFDALERAKEHGDLPEGFAGIVKQLEGAFSTLGLLPIGQVGEAFDPALHEAFGQDPVEKKEADDTVTAVLEGGWKRGEKVLRPAKVRVGQFAG